MDVRVGQTGDSALLNNGLEPVDLAHEADILLGALEILPSRRLLRGPDGDIRVEPKMMQVMVALARRPGAVLSRDDLIDTCWNGRIVGDASVNRIISLLRGVLDDVGADHARITNIPKVGYRLVVLDEDIPSSPHADRSDHPGLAPGKAWRMLGPIAALLGLLALAIGVYAAWPSRPAELEPIRIAMLPFEAIDDGDRFATIGIESEIQTRIGRIQSVGVTRSHGSLSLADNETALGEIAQRLNADYVMVGMLETDAETIAVTARIIDAERGELVWSDRIAATNDRMQDLPERVVRAAMTALDRPVHPDARIIGLQSTDYRLYLTARGIVHSRDRAQMSTAITILRSLTEAEPEFAPAWSLLAAAVSIEAVTAFDEDRPGYDPTAQYQRAQRYIERAIALDGESAEVLAIAGYIAADPVDAVGYLQRSLARDPGNSQTYWWLGHSLANLGRNDEALEAYAKIVDLDPLWRRASYAPSFAAGLGRIEDATTLGKAVAAASPSQNLQSVLAARSARYRGDWSEYLRFLAQIPRAWSQRAVAAAFLGAPVFAREDQPRWNAYRQPVLSGGIPELGVLKASKSRLLWTNGSIGYVVGARMIAAGQGNTLLSLYDDYFANPEKALARSGLQDNRNVMPSIPYVVLALHQADRRREADALLRGALDLYAARSRHTSLSHDDMVHARLDAIAGNRDRAIVHLERAREKGWPHTAVLQTFQGLDPLSEDPAFAAIRTDPRFLRIDRAVEQERALEQADARAMLDAATPRRTR